MKFSLARKNLKGKPGRAAGLIVLSFLLSFLILTGSLVLTGLRSGLSSLDARLGADIMVVPYKAATQNYLEDAILMGNSGYYYMPATRLTDIEEKIDGIEKMSPQLFLVTTKSGCCSYKVSIIGFDPETDFTITPWVQNSYHGTLGDGEIFVGHDLNAYAGDVLKFFDVDVTVAARLDETGTYLDTAVYTNMATAKKLAEAARNKKLITFGGNDVDPDAVISCILIKVQDGYSAESVEGEIKTYIRQVAAVKTETSVEDVSNKLSGIQNLAAALIAAVWILIFIIEMIAFRLSFTSRMKEFAVLRMIGASRKELSRLLMQEALIVSTIGSVIGTALGILVMELFSGQIESSLDMPFLLPGGGQLVLVLVLCIAASILAGTLSALFAARKAGKIDAALILRGDN